MKDELNKLTAEKQKTQVSKLNPKQIGLSKQVKELTTTIKANEEVLENKFNMKNQTDQLAILEEIRWYKSEINKCKHDINDKSTQIDNLTNEAQEYLKA